MIAPSDPVFELRDDKIVSVFGPLDGGLEFSVGTMASSR